MLRKFRSSGDSLTTCETTRETDRFHLLETNSLPLLFPPQPSPSPFSDVSSSDLHLSIPPLPPRLSSTSYPTLQTTPLFLHSSSNQLGKRDTSLRGETLRRERDARNHRFLGSRQNHLLDASLRSSRGIAVSYDLRRVENDGCQEREVWDSRGREVGGYERDMQVGEPVREEL